MQLKENRNKKWDIKTDIAEIQRIRLGTVAHTYNPALCVAEAGGSPEVKSLKPAWPTWGNPVSTKKKTKQTNKQKNHKN